MATKIYLFAFEKFDRYGIDEADARVIAGLLTKAYPHEKFSSGIVEGVLGIRIERAITHVNLDEPALATYRTFVEGAMATREMWER